MHDEDSGGEDPAAEKSLRWRQELSYQLEARERHGATALALDRVDLRDGHCAAVAHLALPPPHNFNDSYKNNNNNNNNNNNKMKKNLNLPAVGNNGNEWTPACGFRRASFQGNDLGLAGATELARAASASTTVRELNFSGNPRLGAGLQGGDGVGVGVGAGTGNCFRRFLRAAVLSPYAAAAAEEEGEEERSNVVGTAEKERAPDSTTASPRAPLLAGLSLCDCGLSDRDVCSLVDVVASHRAGGALAELGLAGNFIGARGAANIAHALEPPSQPEEQRRRRSLPALRRLDLGRNGDIGDEGVVALAAAIRARAATCTNYRGGIGGEEGDDGCPAPEALLEVSLEGVGVGDEGAKALAHALGSGGNRTLRTLRLRGNPAVGNAGAGALVAALKQNAVLRELTLDERSLDMDIRRELAATLAPAGREHARLVSQSRARARALVFCWSSESSDIHLESPYFYDDSRGLPMTRDEAATGAAQTKSGGHEEARQKCRLRMRLLHPSIRRMLANRPLVCHLPLDIVRVLCDDILVDPEVMFVKHG